MVDGAVESAREIAERTGRSLATVRGWTNRGDFPDPAEVGPRRERRYRPAGVDRWLADHPAVAGPPPVDAAGADDELVTLSEFARRIGRSRGTVYQYEPPEAAEGNRYRLADLRAWWDARPGQGVGGGQPRKHDR